MPIKIDTRFVGRAWITPDTPVVAGAWGTWTFTYEVGVYGYDERARLKIASRVATARGRRQTDAERGASSTRARCSLPIKLDRRSVGRRWTPPATPVVAGAWGTWTFTSGVGVYGYDGRARVKIASRFASDWGRPQPEAKREAILSRARSSYP